MNFRLWLETQQDRYSWLDPSGRFHPLPLGSSHSDFAAQILHGRVNPSLSPLAALMQKGWQRIVFMGSELIANNDQTRTINPAQTSALINSAIENKMTKIEFDYGDDLKTIWTSKDF